MTSQKQFSRVSFLALVIAIFTLIVASAHDAQADDPPASAAGWWKSAWKSRVEVRLPENPQRFLRVAIPDSARPASLRCLLTGREVPLEHWVQSMQMTTPVRILASREVPYRFPRMVRASNGHLLLFYNVGASQSSHHPRYSLAAMRESTDGGKTWSPERLLWQEETVTASSICCPTETPAVEFCCGLLGINILSSRISDTRPLDLHGGSGADFRRASPL